MAHQVELGRLQNGDQFDWIQQNPPDGREPAKAIGCVVVDTDWPSGAVRIKRTVEDLWRGNSIVTVDDETFEKVQKREADGSRAP